MNKRRAVINFIISLIFVMVTTNAVVLAEDLDRLNYLEQLVSELLSATPTPTPTPKAAAKLQRSGDEIIPMKNGESKDHIVKIKNMGDVTAQKVSVTASTGGADVPLVIDLPGNTTISSIHGGREAEVTLRIRADAKASDGLYPINLTFSYRDNNNAVVTDTGTVYVRLTADSSQPAVVMQDFKTNSGGIAADTAFTLTAKLQNSGQGAAKDVQLVIDGLSSDGIFLAGTSNNLYFNSIAAGAEENISFNLNSHKDIKGGSYPLSFTLKYKNSAGDTTETSYTYYVNIAAAASEDNSDRASLEISDMPTRTDTYNVGDLFDVAFNLKNTGLTEAKNIKVTAVTDSAGAIVPKSASVRSVARLEAGGTAPLVFSFSPTAASKSQNYVVSFKVEYETGVTVDDKAETAAFEQYFGVNVSNPEEEDETEDPSQKISKPKIIIDSYVVEPIIVKAGEEFDLTMVFRNTHSTKSIENIKAVLTPNETTEKMGSVFMPIGGSNTFYIDKIPPNSTSTQNFRMYAIPAADPRTYTITVDFRYQDEDYNEYDESETIGIPVKQTTKLETGNLMLPDNGYMGSPINIMFNLMNTGKSTLNNLSVTIEGEGFDASKSFMYFGSLNKSASGYYDAEITPIAGGPQKGIILISYEDDGGEVTVIEREFTISIMEDMPMPEMGFDDFMFDEAMMMDNGGSFLDKALDIAKKPLVWVGVAAVCIAAFLGKKFYDKKRRVNFDE